MLVKGGPGGSVITGGAGFVTFTTYGAAGDGRVGAMAVPWFLCLCFPLSRMLSANQYELAFVAHRTAPYWFELLRISSLPLCISSQANTNVLKCSKHSYWPCESILFALRRIASPNVVSIRVSSYWFVYHRCTFVSIRCTFALGFAACLLRLSTLQYDAQRSYCRIGSHMFALVRVSSY